MAPRRDRTVRAVLGRRRTCCSSTPGTSGPRATTSSRRGDGSTNILRLMREPAPESEPTARARAMPSPQAGAALRTHASSRCTCPSSTRSPRTTSGGGRASPSGPTSPRRVPLYAGHDQPKVPARSRLLRPAASPRSERRKPRSPRAHGIEAFCYWHYWFAGRQLLERPFREVLTSGQPRFGFCLGLGEPGLDRRSGPATAAAC